MDTNALATEFEKIYNVKPDFVVRCPGRVNLIGEHIDYNGYGVLPMAIEQCITAAVKSDADWTSVTLKNVNPNFGTFERTRDVLDIDRSNPQWHQYFLCGYRGIIEHLANDNVQQNRGLKVLVYGNVPPSAGLSSSSALVCCAALCTWQALVGKERTLDKTEIAELCARCERYIGTEGGGMDQAISMLANKGQAMKIDFNPLRTEPIQLPVGACFVVCHSCAEMNKAATSYFNERVLECRIATKVIAHAKALPWRDIRTPGQLHKALSANGAVSLQDMCRVVDDVLRTESYTKSEVCNLLGVQEQELNANAGVTDLTKHMTTFHLHNRIYHAYSEASRVEQFADVSRQQPANAIDQLGALMNASHYSCSRLYECSCVELDELTEACRASGAVGSRLTGAGWGGCVVSLVRQQDVDSFIEKIRVGFYEKNDNRIAKYETGTAVFDSLPAAGAEIICL